MNSYHFNSHRSLADLFDTLRILSEILISFYSLEKAPHFLYPHKSRCSPVTPYRQILSKTHISSYLPQILSKIPTSTFLSHILSDTYIFCISLHRTCPISIFPHQLQIISKIHFCFAVTDPSKASHPFLSPADRIKYLHFCISASSFFHRRFTFQHQHFHLLNLPKFYPSHSCLRSYQRSISLSLSQIPSKLHILLYLSQIVLRIYISAFLPAYLIRVLPFYIKVSSSYTRFISLHIFRRS